MKTNLLKMGALALLLSAPLGAEGQGIVGGATSGAEKGNKEAGPVGAIVGGIVGGVAGGISGLLGVEKKPDFRIYVEQQHYPSDTYRAEVRIGNILPEEGIHYYDIPPKYGVPGYRLAIVDDVPVLVDPMTRKIVEVEN